MELEEWFMARADALLRFARLTAGHEVAEDAVQDVLVEAIARWEQISQKDDIDAYLRRCVANRTISMWRRRSTVKKYQHFFESKTVQEEDAREYDLWEGCTQLPVRQRAAVVLRYYEDYSYDRIGMVLDCRVSTARSLVHRGLRSLRIDLDRSKEGDDE